MNEPLRFATNQRHTIFAEGGDANLRYGATLAFGDNQGVMKGSGRKADKWKYKIDVPQRKALRYQFTHHR